MAYMKYLSLARLRADGITEAMMSDTLAYQRIEEFSWLISELTRQHFLSLPLTIDLDGEDADYIQLPIPVLSLQTLTILDEKSASKLNGKRVDAIIEQEFGNYGPGFSFKARRSILSGSVNLTYVTARERELYSSRGIFPSGMGNVRATGFWGWLEHQHEATAITTTELTKTSVDVTVDDVSDFEIGDCIVFLADGKIVFSTIIDSIIGNKLGFEAATDLGASIAIGSTIKTFGRIPAAITRAVLLMIVSFGREATSSEYQESEFLSKLISEKTDNYQYKLESARSDPTGNTIVDKILMDYSAPGFKVLVV